MKQLEHVFVFVKEEEKKGVRVGVVMLIHILVHAFDLVLNKSLPLSLSLINSTVQTITCK